MNTSPEKSYFSNSIQFVELFIFKKGRIKRRTLLFGSLFIWTTYLIFHTLGFYLTQSTHSLLIIPFFLWFQVSLMIKRYHDQNKSGKHLLKAFIPIIGQGIVFWELFFKKGSALKNKFGLALEDQTLDYYQNPKIKSDLVVDDVTRINAVKVNKVVTPESLEELTELIQTSKETLSLGGGRFSMGGQTASENSTHLDLRKLNKILVFNPEKKTIRVQAGTRWCDIQRFLDAHGLSIKIMQTYANFTVGGALSVNCHGRYVRLGPVILSVKEILLITPLGTKIASPTQNKELFYGSIGCYGALGVIAEVELELAENVPLKRSNKIISILDYHYFFQGSIKHNPKSVFHNGDIYPPHYNKVNAVTWTETSMTKNAQTLQPIKREYPIYRSVYFIISESRLGKFFREHILDPLIYLSSPIHWRNFEAGYDVMELEPLSRDKSTYVLQEYFIPVNNFNNFVPKMKEIFNRHRVNVINVSIRHAEKDPGSLLAWAKEEVYAFVVYYKQDTSPAAKEQVAIWTRELIEASLSEQGSYYIPYQPHGTIDQFHRAYPQAKELFQLKDQYDPNFRLRNCLWNKYYKDYKDKKHE